MKNLLITLALASITFLISCKKKNSDLILTEKYQGNSTLSSVSSSISQVDGSQIITTWDTTYSDVLLVRTNFQNDSITFTSTQQSFFTCPSLIMSWLRNETFSKTHSTHEFEKFSIFNDSISHNYSNYGGFGATYNSYSYSFKGSKK